MGLNTKCIEVAGGVGCSALPLEQPFAQHGPAGALKALLALVLFALRLHCPHVTLLGDGTWCRRNETAGQTVLRLWCRSSETGQENRLGSSGWERSGGPQAKTDVNRRVS